jgi:acetylornithine/succinyldiaminopimelate/putrescine aminotransferase
MHGCDWCRCAADNREVVELRRALQGAAGAHDKFFEQLADAEDGFSVVADHYGKGLFSHVDG